jgi:hypothetical protein
MIRRNRRGSGFAVTILITVCIGCGSGTEAGSTPAAKSGPAAPAESPPKTTVEKLSSGVEGDRIEGAKEAVERFGAKPEGTGP